MSRMPYPDVEAVSAEKKAAVGWPERPVLNITRMALHAPDALWRGHFALKQAAVKSTTLDLALREVLILRTACLAQSDYELHHHISIAANLGFTPDKQDALLAGDYSKLTEEERAVAEFTDAVARFEMDDRTFARARALFGEALVMEMMILIASYWGTAMTAHALGLECDVEPIRSWSEQERKNV
jgi:4-carboxymuconolactone decarboxylase